jgi:hypothetical protein
MCDCTITNLKLFLDNATDVGHITIVGARWSVFVLLSSSLWKKLHQLYFRQMLLVGSINVGLL